MANQDFPHGLSAVKMMNGGKIPMHTYTSAATTAIYEGEVVTLRATGVVAGTTTTGGANNIVGVAVHYAAVSSDIAVYDDPMTIFEIQSDGSTDPGATTALAKVGQNAPMVYTAPNTTTKRAQLEFDYSACTTGTADPLKLIGIYQGASNDSTLSHGRYLVLLNKHIMGPHGIRTVI